MSVYTLQQLQQAEILSPLDSHFARFMGRLSDSADPALLLGAALASNWLSRGHTCLELARLAVGPLPLEDAPAGVCPPLPEWLAALRQARVVGTPGQFTPLVLDSRQRLYLYRYWQYETQLAAALNYRAGLPPLEPDRARLADGLARLFPAAGVDGPDWQKVAALTALLRPFCVIVGGPGTGKTSTVIKLLALLLEQPRAEPLRIGLAAPTGKAAARMQEAIQQAKQGLRCSAEVKQAIPEQAATLHRLLGSLPDSPYFRHHAANPLALDLLLVDEASMLDLALMAKLMQALPPQARLILLGDRQQLASVEAGTVLGDICAEVPGFSGDFAARLESLGSGPLPLNPSGPALQDCVVSLRHSYRFGADSGIGHLARAVNSGHGDAALRLLREHRREPAAYSRTHGPYADLAWVEAESLYALKDLLREEFSAYLRASEPEEKLVAFNRFRVLCAHRGGPSGVALANRVVEQVLGEARLLRTSGRWYAGRPLLITENDYNLKLFNGDVGLVLYTPGSRRLRAYFPGQQGLRSILPTRLPAHETVYAMTVHKSQGSEFDHALLWLPPQVSPVLSRELVYTGVTRARRRVTLLGPAQSFRAAVETPVQRASGLRSALWGED